MTNCIGKYEDDGPEIPMRLVFPYPMRLVFPYMKDRSDEYVAKAPFRFLLPSEVKMLVDEYSAEFYDGSGEKVDAPKYLRLTVGGTPELGGDRGVNEL